MGVTPFSLLFSAAGILVAKYCNSDDAVLGTAMSGRSSREVKNTVGMFVNILPVRVKPLGSMKLSSYIGETASLLREVKKHQACPFERLVPHFVNERDESRSPIFDVIVNYLRHPEIPSADGLTVSMMPLQNAKMAMDLKIEIFEMGERTRVRFEYSKELYSEEQIRSMLEFLASVVGRIIDGADITVAEAGEITDEERSRILNDFSGLRTDEGLCGTIVDQFRRIALSKPDNQAVAFMGETLTYAELDALTDRVAELLAKRGVTRGGRVGILIRRSQMMVTGALGVLKAGAAYLPLDPSYPAERLEFMIEDSGAQIVIADSELVSMLSNNNEVKGTESPCGCGAEPCDSARGAVVEYITSEEIMSLKDAAPLSPRTPTPEPPDLFALLYTSGTTGKPKGVMLSHANLMNFCAWYRRYYELTDSDRVAAYASFGFDACLMDLYPALTTGACVHIIPEEMRLDLPALNDYFNKSGVSVAFMTTQLGRQFAQDMKNTSLRALSVGGESLVPFEPPKGYALYNAYGPTECTIFTTTFNVDRLYERVPLGVPLDNTDIYIVDKGGRLAPIGAAGELCIAGRQVAMGYLNRPDLTTEKFVQNPFRDDPDYSRMYRTGDVARFLPDGNLDFIGRSDFQVKIRGFRVELPEIEGRIRRHPAVTDAAVVAHDAPGGGKCAVAYIVGASKIDIGELNAFIEEVLPPYMVPAAVMQLAKIPLNPNGKVDRRKLPEPEFSGVDDSAGESSECGRMSTELELSISKVVAEVLGHENFGVSSNLMRAGLASLSAIKLVTRLHDAFGIAPMVRDLLQEPTVLGIENFIVRGLFEKLKTPSEGEPSTDHGDAQGGIYPLTGGQMGIYIECMKNPESTLYNIPIKVELDTSVDAVRLASVIKDFTDAHSGLRSHLVMHTDDVMQAPLNAQIEVPVMQMTEDELKRFSSEFVRPFDLFSGPLCRAAIVCTEERTLLFADFHHIVFDGTSLDIFMREICAGYDGSPIRGESVSQFKYALMEKSAEGSDEWLEDKAFFDSMLADFDGSSEIKGDLQATGRRGNLAESTVHLNKSDVERFCSEQGVTAASLFLGVLSYVTARWVGSRDVYISTVSSGRSDPALSNTAGMFVRTVPLCIKMCEGSSAQYIRGAAKSLSDSVSHEGYPFTRIAREYLFEPSVMYVCQLGLVDSGYTIGGDEVKWELMSSKEAKFQLSLYVSDRGLNSYKAGDDSAAEDEMITLTLGYDDACYSSELMERFLDTIVTAFANITGSPDSPIRAVSLVSAEQKRLLDSFNRTDDASSERAVIHHMFEDAVKKHPSKTAMIASDGNYSFERLDSEANKLANALIGLGVSREDRVAFILRRTGRIPVAMLGIAKAGCAWIPVDPSYPAERVEHVLSDSGAKYLLTTSDIKEERFHDALDIDELRIGQSSERPDVEVAPNQLALMIYTSGSTGKPKGVMLEHEGIANYITDHPLNPHTAALVEDASVAVSITTVAFDMFMIDSLMTMCNGLTMVLADDEETKDPVRLAEMFEAAGADALCVTPTRIMEYTECPQFLRVLRKCRVIATGGEKFPEALFTRLRGDGAKVRVFNIYGPTEISVACNGKEIKGGGRITTGAPLLGVHEYVVDIDNNTLPCSVVGELLVGGRGVGRGYINLPQQTAERFIMFDGERVYRTGDLGCWTKDGEIEILGRNDNQIKLRGLRIELSEIESAISAVSGIKSCAVMIRKIHGQDHICAWYTATRDIDCEELKAELARTLVPYMLPSAYMQLDVMPKTPNGKNDLRALPEPKLSRTGEYIPPSTPIEEALCSIYEKVLGVERVGVCDSFFEIGGSSLAVTRVIIEATERGVKGESGEKITYGDVFAHPTPRALASLIAGDALAAAHPDDESGYDYTAIDRQLALGTPETFIKGERRELGNLLLTGATGFLGIHVLRDYIRNYAGKIYCLMRRGEYESLELRLKNMLYYYFEDSFDELFEDRIFTCEGDITNVDSINRLAGLPIDTVINCAANVTHFASDSAISDVNTGGVLNLIKLAVELNARLVHVSTCSVAGYRVLSSECDDRRDISMDESMLFFGQNLENQYIHSKFLAERAILESIQKGLDAKIMRVGNLMARNIDGEFQVNLRANSFVSRLRAYHSIGCFPWSGYLRRVELSPIDSTASAILTLADAPRECVVFHPYSNRSILFGDIITAMRDEGLPIEFVDDDVFERAMSTAMKDLRRAERMTSLIAYQNVAQGRSVRLVEANNDYTTQALLRRDWRWPRLDKDYLAKFIRGIAGLGLFEG